MFDEVAFLQLRRIDAHSVLINNIFVDAAARGRGAGSQLLAHALRAHPEFEHVQLDVFSDNAKAHRWYEALGFGFAPSREWLEHPPVSDTTDDFELPNLPQADVVHAAFGFSMVEVMTGSST